MNQNSNKNLIPKNIAELVTQLHNMETLGLVKSQPERKAETASKAIMLAGVVTFLLLCALASWHKFISPLPDSARNLTLWLCVLSMGLPLLSMLLDIAVLAAGVLKFKERQLTRFLSEIGHDESHVNALVSAPKKELEIVKRLLELKVTRIRNRLVLFVGGPDKVALFSLAATGWAVYKALTTKESLLVAIKGPFSTEGTLDVYGILQYILAFLTGIALGAVMTNIQLQRYIYQLELLDLVISRKEKQ